MEELSNKNRTIIIFVVILVVAILVTLFIANTIKDQAGDINLETEPVFQTTSARFSFTPGEVKLSHEDEVDAKNFIFINARIEGRIVSEPVKIGDLYEFAVSFPKSDGESVEATVILPAGENKRIGVVVANDGVFDDEADTITHNARFVSEIVSLINKDEPVQVQFYLHEVTNELREQVMSNSSCQESAESRTLCQAFLGDMEGWYAKNLQLVEAVHGNGELPENHRIEGIQELVIFDDK